MTIKAGVLDGKVISAEDIKELAGLPSREVLLAKNDAVRMYPASTTKMMTLLLGIYPSLVTDLTGPSVEALISDYRAAVPAETGIALASH